MAELTKIRRETQVSMARVRSLAEQARQNQEDDILLAKMEEERNIFE